MESFQLEYSWIFEPYTAQMFTHMSQFSALYPQLGPFWQFQSRGLNLLLMFLPSGPFGFGATGLGRERSAEISELF